ncbi:MAG: HAD family hydrolase [Verrucomicrobia bacterium]|nr:HAD family hydrolase [Verrucomicrobiota bacterium]
MEIQQADYRQVLRSFEPQTEFFVGVDSDGCVFDSMEVKHKECFCPMFIKALKLQSVSKFAREVWEFVNLYSQTRGSNRFLAVTRALKLLGERPEVIKRKCHLPSTEALEEWAARTNPLTPAALVAEFERTKNPDFQPFMDWSVDVNRAVKEIMKGVPLFPYVKESLDIARVKADVFIVSQTPTEALKREWTENQIYQYVRYAAGQEVGKKSEQIRCITEGRYAPEEMLMVGDSPGDLKAIKANNGLFFPIVPGREDEYWKKLAEEGLERFFNGTYKGAYEDALLKEFANCLPSDPPWKQ